MRNFFGTYKGLVAVLAIFGVISISFVANAKKQNNNSLDFGTQIERLAEQVERLVDLIGGEKENTNVETEGASGTTLQTIYGSGMNNPSCLDNYESWPTSTTRRTDADWNVANLPQVSYGNYSEYKQQFLDINGDGLTDYLHMEKKSQAYSGGGKYNTEKSCLLLNNGAGWDVAYQCVVLLKYENSTYTPYYYGDCAQL